MWRLHQYFTSERYLRHLKIKFVSPHGNVISSFLTLKSLYNVTSSYINDPLIRHRPMRPLRLSSSQRLSRANHSLITLTRTSNHYSQYATEGQQLTITGKNTDKIKRKGKFHSIPLIQEFYTFGVMLNLLC